MRKTLYLLPLCAPFVLAGCFSSGSSSNDDNGDPSDPDNGVSGAAAFAKFNAAEETPFPNPMLFDEEAQRVDFDVADSNDLTDQRAAYNTRDGFSTVAPLWIDFSETVADVDPEHLASAIEVTPVDAPYQDGAYGEITLDQSASDVAYRVTVSRNDGSRVYVKPTEPLEPNQQYLVTVQSDVIEADTGDLIEAGGAFLEALEGDGAEDALNQLVQGYDEFAAENELGDLALAFHFRTQTIDKALVSLAENPEAQEATRGDRVGSFDERYTAYDGRLELPYYLAVPETDDGALRGPDNLITQDRSPLETHWNQSAPGALPSDPTTIEVPYLITVPNDETPEAGWPVTVVYHGLTGDRTNLFLIAGTLAEEGLAAIHIDQPFGGLTDADNFWAMPEYERHFFTDYSGDGEPDAAGDNFSGTGYPLTVRDNRRQAVADLLHLIATIQEDGFDDNDISLDGNSITYTGLSNAGIQGATLAGVTDQVDAFSLAVPSGGLAKLPDGAPAFQGQLRERYPQLGRGTAGTVEFEESLILEQGIIDAGDPINYASKAGEKNRIHMIGVVGTTGDPTQLPDLVVPTQVYATGENPDPELGDYDAAIAPSGYGEDGEFGFHDVYLGAPLTGAEPLARVMGLTPVSESQSGGDAERSLVRFTQGSHATWLIPANDDEEAVTAEMQRQSAEFLSSEGDELKIDEPSMILDLND